MRIKAFTLSLALLFCVTACDLNNGFVKYEDIYYGLPVVNTVTEAWRIAASVTYKADGCAPSWKEPRDTYKTMTGDCEDIAALMLAMIINSGLGNGKVAIIDNHGLHAVVLYEGKLYEPQRVDAYFEYPGTKMYDLYSIEEYVKHRSITPSRPDAEMGSFSIRMGHENDKRFAHLYKETEE